MVVDFDEFCCGIHDETREKMKQIPKSDLHNHAGRGGSITYLMQQLDIEIIPPKESFSNIESMDLWFKQNIQSKLPQGVENYLKRVEANLVSAKENHVVSLALDFGIGEIYEMGGMENFIKIITNLNKLYAPDAKLHPVLTIRELRGLEYLEDIFSYKWFTAIDIINYKKDIPMDVLKIVCDFAKNNGLRCKAHIGEFGRAEDVWEYVSNLPLDDLQHGVKVVESSSILDKISKFNVVYNVCPASNIMLEVCKDYKSHPIKKMLDFGLTVTLNTDDQLIFNTSISDEYLNLFSSGALNEKELYRVYCNGMRVYQTV